MLWWQLYIAVYKYVKPTNTLYTLDLCNVVCKLYLSKNKYKKNFIHVDKAQKQNKQVTKGYIYQNSIT